MVPLVPAHPLHDERCVAASVLLFWHPDGPRVICCVVKHSQAGPNELIVLALPMPRSLCCRLLHLLCVHLHPLLSDPLLPAGQARRPPHGASELGAPHHRDVVPVASISLPLYLLMHREESICCSPFSAVLSRGPCRRRPPSFLPQDYCEHPPNLERQAAGQMYLFLKVCDFDTVAGRSHRKPVAVCVRSPSALTLLNSFRLFRLRRGSRTTRPIRRSRCSISRATTSFTRSRCRA